MWSDALWDDKHQTAPGSAHSCVCVCASATLQLWMKKSGDMTPKQFLDPAGWQLSPAPGCRGAINMSTPEPSVLNFLWLFETLFLKLLLPVSLFEAQPLCSFHFPPPPRMHPTDDWIDRTKAVEVDSRCPYCFRLKEQTGGQPKTVKIFYIQ